MQLREKLNSFIGKKIALTGSQIGKLCSLWVEEPQDNQLICGDGWVEFKEHPCLVERYQNDATEWITVAYLSFGIEDSLLTRVESGIELYPDPGKWELDPENTWNSEDIEAAITFLGIITGIQSIDSNLITETESDAIEQVGLSEECKDLEQIINNLAIGKEAYEIEDERYTLEEAVDYLRDYLQELKELDAQIVESGNTPELLKKVYEKYTELWLFQLYFRVDSLPRVIGPLMHYANQKIEKK